METGKISSYKTDRCDHCTGPKIRSSKIDKIKDTVKKKKEMNRKFLESHRRGEEFRFVPLTRKEMNVSCGSFFETKRGKRIKSIYKNIKKDKLYKLVKEYILSSKKDCIFSEDVAKHFQVKTHQVKVAFMKLNQEGVLGQGDNRPPHDCRRSLGLMDWGYDNSWVATRYYIKKKK